MADAILKTVKSPYLCNRLTDFDEIWHDDRVADSKYVIVFDPLLTGHVIQRMRSGRVCIFNANQWETL